MAITILPITERGSPPNGLVENHTGPLGPNIIVALISLFIVSTIVFLLWLWHLRSKKRIQRGIKGCTCFQDKDHFCLPIYWTNDKRCRCGALGDGDLDGVQVEVVVLPPKYPSPPTNPTVAVMPSARQGEGVEGTGNLDAKVQIMPLPPAYTRRG